MKGAWIYFVLALILILAIGYGHMVLTEQHRQELEQITAELKRKEAEVIALNMYIQKMFSLELTGYVTTDVYRLVEVPDDFPYKFGINVGPGESFDITAEAYSPGIDSDETTDNFTINHLGRMTIVVDDLKQ